MSVIFARSRNVYEMVRMINAVAPASELPVDLSQKRIGECREHVT